MFSRLLEIALVAPLPRNDILLNKNASSTLRTKHSLRLAQGGGSAVPPQFTLSGALYSRLSSTCAVTVRSRARSTDPLITGYWLLVTDHWTFFGTSSGRHSALGYCGGFQPWSRYTKYSTNDLLLYQPCQSLTPPGVSFDDYTHLKMESQVANWVCSGEEPMIFRTKKE